MAADTVAAAPAAQAPSPPKEEAKKKGPGWFRRTAHKVATTFRVATAVCRWAFPPILLAIGILLPYPVQMVLGKLAPELLNYPFIEGMIVTLVLGGLGSVSFLIQNAAGQNPKMSLEQLTQDQRASTIWAFLALILLTVVLCKEYPLQIAYIATALYCVVEALVGNTSILRNAYTQTPGKTQIERERQ